MTESDLNQSLRLSIRRGIVRKEWSQHENYVVTWMMLTLIGLFLIQLFFHPLWIAIVATLFGWGMNRRIAGGDVQEGCEEFVFALPPTRRQIFWTRFMICSVPFATLLFGGLLSIWLNIPQFLWGLVVDSGFTVPFAHPGPAWYPLCAVAPAMAFLVSFAGSIRLRNRNGLFAIWIVSSLTVGIPLLIGLLIDANLDDLHVDFFPVFGCLFPVAAGGLSFWWFHRQYLLKEGHSNPFAPTRKSSRGVIVAIIIAVILFLIVFFVGIVSLYSGNPTEPKAPEKNSRNEPAPVPAETGDSSIPPSDESSDGGGEED